MKLHGSNAIHGIYVTCCKTSLPWVCKARNVWDFVVKKKNRTFLYCLQQLFAICNNPICWRDRFNSVLVSRVLSYPSLRVGVRTWERGWFNSWLFVVDSWLVLKTRNVATQLVLLQYCKTSLPFLLSVLPCLKENLCRLVLLKITLSFRCMWLLIGDLLW